MSTDSTPDAESPRPSSGGLSEPKPGADNYQVGDEIARGGMGSVLEAEDGKLRRTVAVKIMLQGTEADPEMRRRFIHEAEVLAALAHPDIVPIYDIVWEDGLPLFYSMKRVNGRTLQHILNGLRDRKPDDLRDYTLDRLLVVFRKVCDAIAFAHSKGYIHRDLKPENVMVGEFGEVLVMDWGLAKKIGDCRLPIADCGADGAEAVSQSAIDNRQSEMTLAGAIMGTPQYMSPEQAQGLIDELDERSDVFSLGGILYAILTLRPPVEGKTVPEILSKLTAGEIAPPSSTRRKAGASPNGAVGPPPHLANGRVPAALSAVAMKALQNDKADRYQGVPALAVDIEKYQNGFATSAEDASFFTQLVLLIRRRRREFSVAAVAVLVLLAATIWFIINLQAKERRAIAGEESAVKNRDQARRELARAQITLADSAFHHADEAGLAQALEGCPVDWRDQSWEYLAAKRDASERVLGAEVMRNATAVCALPGKPGWFALLDGEGNVEIIDSATDRVVRRIATDFGRSNALAASADGRILAVSNKVRKVRLFEIETGALHQEFTAPFAPTVMALNADASRVALASTSGPKQSAHAVCDPTDGHVLWQRDLLAMNLNFMPDGTRLLVSSHGGRRIVELLSVGDGSVLARVDCDGGSQAISPDGNWIAIGSNFGDLLIVDGRTGVVLNRTQAHDGRISGLAFTAEGHLLSCGIQGKFRDGRNVFRLWEPEKLLPVGTYFGLKSGSEIAWSLDPVSAHWITAESPPRLWNLHVGREWVKMLLRGEQGWAECFISDTLLLTRSTDNRGLTRWDLSTPGKAIDLGDALGFRSGASNWATGLFALGWPGQRQNYPPVRADVCAVEEGKVVRKRTLQMAAGQPYMAFDARGENLVGVQVDGPITLCEVKTGAQVLVVKGSYQAVVFAGGGRNLVALTRHDNATGEAESTLVALDGEHGVALRRLTYPFHVSALAASLDGSLVAVGGADQSVHLVDVATLSEKSVFRAHDGEVTALAFHPTKPLLATGSIDRTVKLWTLGGAQMVDHFDGLGGTPVVLAFNPSGTLLLVDGQEHTNRVFDVSAAGKRPAKP